MDDLKSKATTIAGLIFAVCSAIVAASTSGFIVLPVAVVTIAGLLAAISGAVIGFFTGKNADGSAKSASQIQDQKNSK